MSWRTPSRSIRIERLQVSICFWPLSLGINFLLISGPTVSYLEGLLDEIYVLFADYVMKVRCAAFFSLEPVL